MGVILNEAPISLATEGDKDRLIEAILNVVRSIRLNQNNWYEPDMAEAYESIERLMLHAGCKVKP